MKKKKKRVSTGPRKRKPEQSAKVQDRTLPLLHCASALVVEARLAWAEQMSRRLELQSHDPDNLEGLLKPEHVLDALKDLMDKQNELANLSEECHERFTAAVERAREVEDARRRTQLVVAALASFRKCMEIRRPQLLWPVG